ncbi:MAG: histone H1-like protein [Acidobacteriaceae bacterium]|nr:histone H1-like protein [Acidobacteriaceae bacterium]
MQTTMHEFKHHELKSGRSGKQVKNPKQAIAIGLSEARRSGANIPPSPNAKKASAKKTATKKSAAPSKAAKRAAPNKSATKNSSGRSGRK